MSDAPLSPRLWVEKSPLPQCSICVIVPVRNEAENLPAVMQALAHQVDLRGGPLDPRRYEVIVFANNCTDRSADVVRRAMNSYPQLRLHLIERELPSEEAYIGRVRQLLMNEAYHRLLQLGELRGAIASTDGDTQVGPTWVATILQELGQGADAVGGRIVTSGAGRKALDVYARSYHLRSVGYALLTTQLEDGIDPNPADPAPRHHQFYGANFAVTCEAYARAGGMPPVHTPEDVALRDALIRVGARLRHSLAMRVTTSARQVGRTSIGLASQLTEWQVMGQRQQALLVESAAALEAKLRARRDLRRLWRRLALGELPLQQEIDPLAARFAISAEWLWEELEALLPFDFLYQRIEQRQSVDGLWQRRWELVPIEVAIAGLRLRLSRLR